MVHNNLKRFIDAQEKTYKSALAEIKNGKKQTHWMWFIFPQIQGLGYSSTSKFYAIHDLQEAADYLKHDVLGRRLIEICHALMSLSTSDPRPIFGSPDDLKLCSSMTLFSEVESGEDIFNAVLKKFFNGAKDKATLKLIGKE